MTKFGFKYRIIPNGREVAVHVGADFIRALWIETQDPNSEVDVVYKRHRELSALAGVVYRSGGERSHCIVECARSAGAPRCLAEVYLVFIG